MANILELIGSLFKAKRYYLIQYNHVEMEYIRPIKEKAIFDGSRIEFYNQLIQTYTYRDLPFEELTEVTKKEFNESNFCRMQKIPN